ncbi:MAG: OmpA family protein [Euzebyales bacterium]|nr:OmpA family protein [Euzebyales bacterium]
MTPARPAAAPRLVTMAAVLVLALPAAPLTAAQLTRPVPPAPPPGARGEILQLTGAVLDLEGEPLDLLPSVSTLGGQRTVTRKPSGAVEIRLSADVLFPYGSAALTPPARIELASVGRRLAAAPAGVATVEGHTDARGDAAYNQRLSVDRARAVTRFLAPRVGDVRFRVRGRGERDPIAPNLTRDGRDNPAGRNLNRRVEITFRQNR